MYRKPSAWAFSYGDICKKIYLRRGLSTKSWIIWISHHTSRTAFIKLWPMRPLDWLPFQRVKTDPDLIIDIGPLTSMWAMRGSLNFSLHKFRLAHYDIIEDTYSFSANNSGSHSMLGNIASSSRSSHTHSWNSHNFQEGSFVVSILSMLFWVGWLWFLNCCYSCFLITNYCGFVTSLLIILLLVIWWT